MEHRKVEGRREYVAQLVKDYHADGVIYEQIKFCEYWGYERAIASHVLVKDFEIRRLWKALKSKRFKKQRRRTNNEKRKEKIRRIQKSAH